MARWKQGDVIKSRRDPDGRREIVDVRPTGYGWKYPEFGPIAPDGMENYYLSENSCDPFFDLGWVAVQPNS